MAFSPTSAVAKPSGATTTIVSIEPSGDLGKAVDTLNNSSKDKAQELVSVNYEPFESPLTQEQKDTIEKLKEQINIFTDLIERHENLIKESPVLKGIYSGAIAGWKSTRSDLVEKKNALEKIENDAYEEWKRTHRTPPPAASLASPSSLSVSSTALENFIDKFEEWGIVGLRLKKKIFATFEREAKDYIANEPQLLFVSEYVVDGIFYGALICIKKYKNSTHYEFFKKNAFQDLAEYERFLFLDTSSLQEETERLTPYVKEVMGLNKFDPSKHYLVLDHRAKQDRIYSYKISAARVPQKVSEVDYDLVLESKGLLDIGSILNSSTGTLFQHSAQSLGSQDLAWVFGVVNENIVFFGKGPKERPLSQLIDSPVFLDNDTIQVFKPKNINDILCILHQSVSIFGIRESYKHLVQLIGGLPFEFVDSFENAVDDTTSRFSYQKFRNSLKQKKPVFKLVFEIAESQDSEALSNLSNLDIKVPLDDGVENMSTILGISKVFKFINDTFLTLSFSQEGDTFSQLRQIKDGIDKRRAEEDPAVSAIEQLKNAEISAPSGDTGEDDSFFSNIFSFGAEEEEEEETRFSFFEGL